MRFFVTYAAADNEVGGNPFWHACVMVSYWPGPGHPVQVLNNVGFYGRRTTTPPSWFRSLKIKLGLDVDLWGNHGLLKSEELRFYDMGYGLWGKTFEISLEQFLDIKKYCVDKIKDQEAALTEAAERLGIENNDANSLKLYEEEIRHRTEKGLKPRLSPFEFALGVDKHFRSGSSTLNPSQTCKTQALEVLRHAFIDEREIKTLAGDGSYLTVPKHSGPLERLILHSTGPRKTHESKRTGEVYFFREYGSMAKDTGEKTQHCWTLPPSYIVDARMVAKGEALSLPASTFFTLPAELEKPAKVVTRRLQSIEKILLHATVDEDLRPRVDNLIKYVVKLYQAFSKVNPKDCKDDWQHRITQGQACLMEIKRCMEYRISDDKLTTSVVSLLATKDQKKLGDIVTKPIAEPVHMPARPITLASY